MKPCTIYYTVLRKDILLNNNSSLTFSNATSVVFHPRNPCHSHRLHSTVSLVPSISYCSLASSYHRADFKLLHSFQQSCTSSGELRTVLWQEQKQLPFVSIFICFLTWLQNWCEIIGNPSSMRDPKSTQAYCSTVSTTHEISLHE